MLFLLSKVSLYTTAASACFHVQTDPNRFNYNRGNRFIINKFCLNPGNMYDLNSFVLSYGWLRGMVKVYQTCVDLIAASVSIQEQLLRRNMKGFRGGLAFKAHRLLYYSTLGWRVMKKRKEKSVLNA